MYGSKLGTIQRKLIWSYTVCLFGIKPKSFCFTSVLHSVIIYTSHSSRLLFGSISNVRSLSTVSLESFLAQEEQEVLKDTNIVLACFVLNIPLKCYKHFGASFMLLCQSLKHCLDAIEKGDSPRFTT